MINPELKCHITGIGAYGPGFTSWSALTPLLKGETAFSHEFTPPKPEVILANERRRAPLPVKLAVETSFQALQMAKMPASDVACVFGSGLGDMQITDYLCKVLNSENKLVSPTKFHNSVHNAAAGYWTISTDCMQPANSIAAFQHTFGIALLEAMSQCVSEDIPVLITLFDIPVVPALTTVIKNPYAFSASLLIVPEQENKNCLSIQCSDNSSGWPSLKNPSLAELYQNNPAAKMLLLLEKLIINSDMPTQIPLSPSSTLKIHTPIGEKF